jgi:hypothetical protein
MAQNDYAVLIGISHYPQLGDNKTTLDLKAPVNDVDALKEWLVDPNGGDVPPANVTTITSADFPTNPTALDQSRIVKPLKDIDSIYDQMVQTNGPLQFGRRLYIFVSGHGFSPGVRRGSLFTADAVDRWGENIDVSGWLDFFQDAGYFREFVLLMDCCMNRISQIKPVGPSGRERAPITPPGPTFVAFAARRPLKAAEYHGLLKPGVYNGAFTSVLLEGLRGAASDRYGRVTGRSLADWIRNAQAGRLSPDDQADANVSQEPEVIQESPALIFARVPALTYEVDLTFPENALGHTARLWSGEQAPSQHFTVTSNKHTVQLTPGLYVVEMPDKTLRHGFEVSARTTVTVLEQGPAVRQADTNELYSLAIDPDDPTAEIFIIDGKFGLVESDRPKIETKLPFGVYKIKVRIGRAVKQRVILLDGSLDVGDGEQERVEARVHRTSSEEAPTLLLKDIVPTVGTAALALGTAQTHEYQIDAADRERVAVRLRASQTERPKPGAAVTVMARVFSGTLPRPDAWEIQPWIGINVVDERGQPILDLESDGLGSKGSVSGDPFAIVSRTISPGTYYLRQARLDCGTVEQSIIVPEGWCLEVYILRHIPPTGTELGLRRRISIQLRDLQGIHDAKRDDRLVETARIALADERSILNPQLAVKLFRELDDPMAGIIGGHLLFLEEERGGRPDLRLLDDLVRKLRERLGDDYPDVEALSLRCSDEKLRRTRAIIAPPMFERSWRLLVNASYSRPRLVPRKIWERVVATSSVPLYLTWSIDGEIRKKSVEQLMRLVSTNEDREEARLSNELVHEASPADSMISAAVPSLRAQTDHRIPIVHRRKAFQGATASKRERTRRIAKRLGLPSAGLALLRTMTQSHMPSTGSRGRPGDHQD